MRSTHKIAGLAVAMITVAGLMSGCTTDSTASANNRDRKTAGEALAHFEDVQPAPKFDWSQIRQTLIDAEQATAESTQTTTFMFNQGVADPVFVCPSIGFPVAASSELTNPAQMSGNSYGNVTLEQMDPNGIYPGASSATYVLCVNTDGQVYLHHVEEFAHAVSGPATWDYTHHRIVMTGAPTFKVTPPKS